MCFLASISNSNVSNELEKSSDWERLGIRKLKNNPDLKEANEGVPQKCTFECSTLQNVQRTLPVEYYYCFCAILCWHWILFLSVSSPLWSPSPLIFLPRISCSHERNMQPLPDSDKLVLLLPLPKHSTSHIVEELLFQKLDEELKIIDVSINHFFPFFSRFAPLELHCCS